LPAPEPWIAGEPLEIRDRQADGVEIAGLSSNPGAQGFEPIARTGEFGEPGNHGIGAERGERRGAAGGLGKGAHRMLDPKQRVQLEPRGSRVGWRPSAVRGTLERKPDDRRGADASQGRKHG
jgi:hypothetical protein